MNVTNLIDEMILLFPRFNRAWEQRYREVLQEHNGPVLEAAFKATMLNWTKSMAPRPADFLGKITLPSDGPPFNTRKRVLWDLAWAESRDLHAGWNSEHPRADADRLGYIEHHLETAKHMPNRRAG